MFTPDQERYIASIEEIHEYPHTSGENIIPEVQLFSKNLEIFVFGKTFNYKLDIKDNQFLINFLRQKMIKNLFVPDCSSFTGLLCEGIDFPYEHHPGDLKIITGAKTEGIVVPVGGAILFKTADCYTVTYHDIKNDKVITVHAGLKSIIDKQKIITGVESRPHESVVDDMARYMKETDHYEIFLNGGIGFQSFIYNTNDPVYGETNKKILSYLIDKYGKGAVPLGIKHGGISMKYIIRQQFISYGIDPELIRDDGIDTYSDPKFFSHYRAKEMGWNDGGRNGILVIHK